MAGKNESMLLSLFLCRLKQLEHGMWQMKVTGRKGHHPLHFEVILALKRCELSDRDGRMNFLSLVIEFFLPPVIPARQPSEELFLVFLVLWNHWEVKATVFCGLGQFHRQGAWVIRNNGMLEKDFRNLCIAPKKNSVVPKIEIITIHKAFLIHPRSYFAIYFATKFTIAFEAE